MSNYKHVLRNAAASIIVIVLGAVIFEYFFTGSVPRAFLDARLQAAGASNNAALLINNSLSNLSKIERMEANNSNDQALDLVGFEISQKQEKQNAAILLAAQLQTMADAANAITSGRARGMALEAVTSGISLVSRLVAYNNSLDNLFAAIQYKILNGAPPAGVNLRSVIASLNADAKSINDLNTKFNALLSEIDEAYGG